MTLASFLCAALFIVVGAVVFYINTKNIFIDISDYRRWPEHRRYKLVDAGGHGILALLGVSLIVLGAWLPSAYNEGQTRYDRFEQSCTQQGGTVVDEDGGPISCWKTKIELEY